ncbi:MAG: peroxidase-related enzyme [Terracidiphilus sp.]
MPHIDLPEGAPGIVAGFNFRPETAKPMRELAHILLHEPNSLTGGERELIAAYVSSRNKTTFCELSHGAAASAHLGDPSIVERVKADFREAPISPKLKALIAIAGKVQQDGKLVTPLDVDRARQQGATDMEIHDTVLIAAAFSMYNRYVDGLGTLQPTDPDVYTQMGRHLADEGYRVSSIRQPVGAD